MHGINTSSHSVVCGGTKYLPLLPLNLLQSMASNHSVLPQITVAICCCKNPLNFNVLCLVIPPPLQWQSMSTVTDFSSSILISVQHFVAAFWNNVGMFHIQTARLHTCNCQTQTHIHRFFAVCVLLDYFVTFVGYLFCSYLYVASRDARWNISLRNN